MNEKLTGDFRDMIYAETASDVEKPPQRFSLKWRLKYTAVATSLEASDKTGEELITLARLPPSQWQSARTTDPIGRMFEACRRRINTQVALPGADTAPLLRRAQVALEQIRMRIADG